MEAWAESQGVSKDDKMITLMGDPYGDLTKALKMELTAEGPNQVGLVQRCKRFASCFENNVARIGRVAEAPNDPAGDDFPDTTLAEAMIDAIKAYQAGSGGDEL